MTQTPMMRQYEEAKKACPDALLLFRMGDFYELFHDDAKEAARLLNLTLTSREKGAGAVPMAGFPHHQLDTYLARLIEAGKRVAVCEQVEDPRKAKGLVDRKVTRIVSRGTLTDDALLDPRESNFLAAIVVGEPSGMAWVDLSTGAFHACRCRADELADHVARVNPAECLVSEDAREAIPRMESAAKTVRPAWAFSSVTARESLTRHFETRDLAGFGFDEADEAAVRAAGAIIDYLQETQQTELHHIDRLTPYRTGHCLEIDEATRRSLEITRTLREGRREGSLLGVLDRTKTAMGARMLNTWLSSPLTDVDEIQSRLDAVEELKNDLPLGDVIRGFLANTYDLDRLLARIVTGRASPRDLNFVGHTLRVLPRLQTELQERSSCVLRRLEQQLEGCPRIRDTLSRALVDDCGLASRDGGFIRSGYDATLDELRELTAGGKQWIAAYQAEESRRTEIPNIKIGFNKVFGYYLEVTNAHADKVPSHYIRKQTIKNAERYITPPLKEHEEGVLSAEQRAKDLEYDLFVALRAMVAEQTSRLKKTAAALAQLDVLAALAELARERSYCRPQPTLQRQLHIVDGRHPVLEILEPEGTFVPNSTQVSPDDGLILIITGPNMAGKSTYIRQVALITLMTQIGSFVPAAEATIGVADRVFARVGASDELARGQSTFMVEMIETARILNTATEQSLVILDEIGRGTSTFDGISLAWSVVEDLHDRVRSRTLFATHYHELTDLARSLSGVTNLNVAVREWEDKVVFLHQIVPGSADKSYGIHVARLAGVPRGVNERAKEILSQLEDEHLDPQGRPRIARREDRKELQLTLFGPAEHPLLDEIREVDINATTPLEALRLIGSWKQQLKTEGVPKPR